MIAVPMIAGLSYIVLLDRSLNVLDNYHLEEAKTDRLLLLKDLVLVGCSRRVVLFGMFRATQKPLYKQKYLENEAYLKSMVRALAQLCQDNPSRMLLLKKLSSQMQYMERSELFLVNQPSNATISELMGGPIAVRVARNMLLSHTKAPLVREFEREEARIIELENQEQAQAKQISTALIAGLIYAVVLDIGLIWWFKHSISTL